MVREAREGGGHHEGCEVMEVKWVEGCARAEEHGKALEVSCMYSDGEDKAPEDSVKESEEVST